MNADELIARLGLEAHPEGGWFRETYRSGEILSVGALPSRFGAPHCFATSIYFLLRGGEFSALHRIKADEVWHFHAGSPLTVHSIAPDGTLSQVTLGEQAGCFQTVVPAGHWFGATMDDDRAEAFVLVGCTVAPGFLFEDFELGNRVDLLARFPQHRTLIERLTREER